MGTIASNLLEILAPVGLPKCAPNEPQRVVLLKLQTSLFASMAAENNHIMEEIWTRSSLFPNSPYEQVSEKWRSFGFQNNNPISDVRGGGELSMRCLLRFDFFVCSPRVFVGSVCFCIWCAPPCPRISICVYFL